MENSDSELERLFEGSSESIAENAQQEDKVTFTLVNTNKRKQDQLKKKEKEEKQQNKKKKNKKKKKLKIKRKKIPSPSNQKQQHKLTPPHTANNIKKRKLTIITNKNNNDNTKKKEKKDVSFAKEIIATNNFPQNSDFDNLSAFIHYTGYSMICGNGEELKDVEEETMRMSSKFKDNMSTLKQAIFDEFSSLIKEKAKDNDKSPENLMLLLKILRENSLMIIPSIGKSTVKSEAFQKSNKICPWTNAILDSNSISQIVFIPDDEENNDSFSFWTHNYVAEILKAFHTFFHFELYIEKEIGRIVNNAVESAIEDEDENRTLEQRKENADVIWNAIFDENGNIPTAKRSQKEGTRLIGTKKTLLKTLCNSLKSILKEETFLV